MILDTNTYTALLLDDRVVTEMLVTDDRLGLPLPVIAELRNGFLGGSKFVENSQILQKILARTTTVVLMPTLETTKQYATLQDFAKSKGRVLSNNDIWIAALARQDGDTLVTYDKDFHIFQDYFGDKLKVLS